MSVTARTTSLHFNKNVLALSVNFANWSKISLSQSQSLKRDIAMRKRRCFIFKHGFIEPRNKPTDAFELRFHSYQ